MTVAITFEEFSRRDALFCYKAFDRSSFQTIPLNHIVTYPYEARKDVVDLQDPMNHKPSYTCVDISDCPSNRVFQLIREEGLRLERSARKITKINVDFTPVRERILFEWIGEEK